ncbi:MAG: rhamnogalacturonan lyase [Bacteroidales bacterium]|nr:rhamnogalacturonan lyase [Bacteroidales bacterium]
MPSLRYVASFAAILFSQSISSVAAVDNNLANARIFKMPTSYDYSKLEMEKLGRGVIAIRQNTEEVFVSWRYLKDDPFGVAFNVYRDGQKINKSPISDVTFVVDKNSKGGEYMVKSVIDGKEVSEIGSSFKMADDAPVGYIDISLNKPADGVTPAGDKYTYSPNDCSMGDMDGDGEMEIVLKWDPSNSHDNAHDGYTGNVIIDCYKLNGKQLWRIDLGKNIRAGAHYTQFLVYDFDHDGKAEMICKTADGTVDGLGKVIGDSKANYVEPGSDMEQVPAVDFKKTGINPAGTRNRGRIISGPEFLTVFDGLTGKALDTVDYIPPRGNMMDWGDNYANRSDRHLACIAFLDGKRASAVMCRGYYTRTVLAAYDWDGKKLVVKWVFDSLKDGRRYEGQGNHNVFAADVDHDGCDEIVYGSCTIDHNGKGLYTTGLGHGDAMHITQFSPEFDGLQGFFCHENKRDGVTFRDLATGKIIWQVKNGSDVGRCMAADVDMLNPGVEMWAGGGIGFRDIKGKIVSGVYSDPNSSTLTGPSNLPVNFAVWWDGDLLRELLNGNTVSKFDWETGRCKNLMIFQGCSANNGSKSNPCLSCDIVGDWREEVLMRTNDNEHLRLYVSTIPTKYRFHTFLQEPVYRNSVASQNTCYNQPTHTGFYFGPDLLPTTEEKPLLFRGTLIK